MINTVKKTIKISTMRTNGAKNKRPAYMSDQTLNKKAAKTKAVSDDFIEKSLRNNYFNKLVDYNKLYEISDHLNELSTIKVDRS